MGKVLLTEGESTSRKHLPSSDMYKTNDFLRGEGPSSSAVRKAVSGQAVNGHQHAGINTSAVPVALPCLIESWV